MSLILIFPISITTVGRVLEICHFTTTTITTNSLLPFAQSCRLKVYWRITAATLLPKSVSSAILVLYVSPDILIALPYILRKCLDLTVCKFEITSSGRRKCFSAFKNKPTAAEMAHLRSAKGCTRLDCFPKWSTTHHSRNCK